MYKVARTTWTARGIAFASKQRGEVEGKGGDGRPQPLYGLHRRHRPFIGSDRVH